MDIPEAFIDASRRYLVGEYEPKITRCLELLSDDEIWWRPNERSNSIGNLVLHLAGNIRQYVVSGVGGEEDVRRRDEEFAARGVMPREDLLDHLHVTLHDVDGVLERLSSADLGERRVIQGRSTTVFDAIYHAVEHFSMHTGQIIQITKQLKDRDLGFYTFQDGSVQRTWQRD